MQQTLSFTKMHGLGNDFIVLNNLANTIHLKPEQICLLADRHLGIGCDQVLLLDPPPNSQVDFGYRIFNADGSPSGQCGNGARCLAKFIQFHQLASKTNLRVATSSAVMELMLLPNGDVRVNMGNPNFLPAALPMQLPQQLEYQLPILNETITFSALSMGNPHVVIRVDNVEEMAIGAIGQAFNTHPLFPEGVNVGFMQIIDKQHIKLRVFERGARETLACGSGACAAMVAASLHGWTDSAAEISLPGGVLFLEWQGIDHPVWMTGSATIVFTGVWYL